ncbi:MAG: hypothetical protein Tsb005_16790 [Gammaproteobacteria bacterium]
MFANNNSVTNSLKFNNTRYVKFETLMTYLQQLPIFADYDEERKSIHPFFSLNSNTKISKCDLCEVNINLFEQNIKGLQGLLNDLNIQINNFSDYQKFLNSMCLCEACAKSVKKELYAKLSQNSPVRENMSKENFKQETRFFSEDTVITQNKIQFPNNTPARVVNDKEVLGRSMFIVSDRENDSKNSKKKKTNKKVRTVKKSHDVDLSELHHTKSGNDFSETRTVTEVPFSDNLPNTSSLLSFSKSRFGEKANNSEPLLPSLNSLFGISESVNKLSNSSYYMDYLPAYESIQNLRNMYGFNQEKSEKILVKINSLTPPNEKFFSNTNNILPQTRCSRAEKKIISEFEREQEKINNFALVSSKKRFYANIEGDSSEIPKAKTTSNKHLQSSSGNKLSSFFSSPDSLNNKELSNIPIANRIEPTNQIDSNRDSNSDIDDDSLSHYLNRNSKNFKY